MMRKAIVVVMAGLGVGARAQAGDLSILLDPGNAVFSSAEDARIWVTLRNAEPDCRPLLVDTVFARFESPRRPQTLVTLMIKDATGRIVKSTHEFDATARALQPHELVPLLCGTSYGHEVRLSGIPWSYALRAGQYTMRARVSVTVASFLKNRDALSQSIESLWRATIPSPFIRDAEGESNEVTFIVGK